MGRTLLGLIVCLLATDALAAEIHLKNGSMITGRIREQGFDFLLLDRIVMQGGTDGRTVTSEGTYSIPNFQIEMVILDEADLYKKTGKETFEVLDRDEVVVEIPEEPKAKEIEIDIGDIEIDPEIPTNGDEPGLTIWRPAGVGKEVPIAKMGLAMKLPTGFRHEVVTKGGRSVLRVISPPEDKVGIGFNLWVQKKREFAPFDSMDRFFDYTQAQVMKTLSASSGSVEEMEMVYPRITPQAGSAPRQARGKIYSVGKGSKMRRLEVRVLRTFDEFYVFTFSTNASIAGFTTPIFEKCYNSLRNLK
ncbi:MAG: hypothetical protein O6952_07285 [Planctomycetota bacterium]|nr:hypothetical protein [Planctomycetota bacterium]